MSLRACEHCGKSLIGRRAGTRFCDAACRFDAWLAARPEKRRERAAQRAATRNLRAASRRRDLSDSRWRPSLTPEQARAILAAVDDPEIRRRLIDASPEAVRRRREEREARR